MTRGGFIGCLVIAGGLVAVPAFFALIYLLAPVPGAGIRDYYGLYGQLRFAAALAVLWLAVYPVWSFGAWRRFRRRGHDVRWSLAPAVLGLMAPAALALGGLVFGLQPGASSELSAAEVDQTVVILDAVDLGAAALFIAAFFTALAMSVEALRPDETAQ